MAYIANLYMIDRSGKRLYYKDIEMVEVLPAIDIPVPKEIKYPPVMMHFNDPFNDPSMVVMRFKLDHTTRKIGDHTGEFQYDFVGIYGF